MNYHKLYCQIIFSAKSVADERKRQHKLGTYFEIHHICPKSLGGSNDAFNLVLLTGREHFICHWLLVKMYPLGTESRYKMINALWRMRSNNGMRTGFYINARAYEALRIEWSKCVGQLTSKSQSGRKNSQYGKHWFTSFDTGESKFLMAKPSDRWISGRNWFNNAGKVIYDLVTHDKYTLDAQRHYETKHHNDKLTHVKVTYYDGYCKKYVTVMKNTYETNVAVAHQRWDKFHSGSYESLRSFAKSMQLSVNAVYNMFKRYIPAYEKYAEEKRSMCSNKELVGIYE